MTALIVIAAIILAFALLLHIRVRAEIRYIGGELDFKVKYLFFTVYPMKKKRKKPKRIKKSKKNDNAAASESPGGAETAAADGNAETAENTENCSSEESGVKNDVDKKEKAEKEKLSDKINKLLDIIEKVKIIWGFSAKRLKRIFTHIYLDGLFIDFIIAGEDAHKTAVSYGTVNAVVFNAVSAVRGLFPVTIKTVDIVCDFDRKEPVYDCGVNVTLSPSVVISAAFGILGGFLWNLKKLMKKTSEQSEAAAQA